MRTSGLQGGLRTLAWTAWCCTSTCRPCCCCHACQAARLSALWLHCSRLSAQACTSKSLECGQIPPRLPHRLLQLMSVRHDGMHRAGSCCRVRGMRRDPCGAVHVCIGDGGNREGLALNYLPRPDWSDFRCPPCSNDPSAVEYVLGPRGRLCRTLQSWLPVPLPRLLCAGMHWDCLSGWLRWAQHAAVLGFRGRHAPPRLRLLSPRMPL